MFSLLGLGTAIVVALISIAWGVIWAIDVANREDTPERYADLAELLAQPLIKEGQVADRLSLAEQEAALRRYEACLQKSRSECRDLARYAQANLNVLAAARELQKEQPAIENLFAGIARTALGVAVQSTELVESGGASTIDRLEGVAGFVRRIKELQVAGESNALEFAENVPARFSGPASAKPLLGVTFLPPAGFLSTRKNKLDMVTLENVCGADLHDCFVVVRLKGKSGETFSNVHFVRNWPAGTKRFAEYDDGLFGHTVDDPVSVTMKAWSREGSSPPVTIQPGLLGW